LETTEIKQLLNNQWIKEESRKQYKIIETNENEDKREAYSH
jgi:hypothetical protein